MNPWQSAVLRIFLYLFGTLVSFFPRKFELWFGKKIGFVLFFFNERKKIALENIQRCLPELKEVGWKNLLRKNYEHYGVLVLELLHLFSPLPMHFYRYCKKNTVVEGVENYHCAHQKGKGVLCVASHLGNWELMTGGGAMVGIPVTIVTKHLKPDWLHKKIESSRAQTGIKGAYEPRPLPAILRALRKKETVGFVLDQYAGAPIGIPINFFGYKVGTLTAVGSIAKRTGASVLPACVHRDSCGIVHICFEPELDLKELLEDEENTTQILAHKIETWIRKHPEQWLWIHRRFKKVHGGVFSY